MHGVRNWGVAGLLAAIACGAVPTLAAGAPARSGTCFSPPKVGRLASATLKNIDTCVTDTVNMAHGFVSSIEYAVDKCPLDQDRARTAETIARLSNEIKPIEQDKKVAVKFFRAVQSWYEDHGKTKVAGEVGGLTDEIGKVTLLVVGFYSNNEAVASAIRNNDCAEARSKLEAVQKSDADAARELKDFHTALAKLK